MNILNKRPLGIGKKGRRLLSDIISHSKGAITPADAEGILRIPHQEVLGWLSLWAKHGWLSRIKRGVYLPVPVESTSAQPAIEDPWIIANCLFDPCYIGGWSAAEHWGFTEQIFNTTTVITSQNVKKSEQKFANTTFLIKRTHPDRLFGTQATWKNGVKVNVSDPSRTIIDLLNDPKLGGGIRMVEEILEAYFRSEHKNSEVLIDYAQRLGNRTIFKRLGFFLERMNSQDNILIDYCLLRISKGYSQLDPLVKGKKIISKWRLWIPDCYL